jgi:hypothetical protein
VLTRRGFKITLLAVRRVVPSSRDRAAKLSLEGTPRPSPDTYKDRLLKYIPAEVVALYLTLHGSAAAARDTIPQAPVQWAIFAILLAATPLYTLRITKIPGAVPAKRQAGIAMGAFLVWVFALGGPFTQLSWYQGIYGTLLLPLYTFFVPFVEGDPL